jgi:hypothetical protein
MEFIIFSTISLLASLALAIPTPQATCGSEQYSASEIIAAQNAACSYVSSSTTAGSSTYPHTYRDEEGFTFAGVSGPYYEFPILASGKVYTGGKIATPENASGLFFAHC